MRAALEQALELGYLRHIDLHAGLFLSGMAGRSREEVLLAGALASRAVGEGHICLPLACVAGRTLFDRELQLKAPEQTEWQQALHGSGVAAPPGEGTPLVLDAADRLYFARYYRCEDSIGADLLRRCRGMLAVDPRRAASLLDRLFPGSAAGDRQKLAAALALLKRFLLISGGPGTGKTFTVARILALVQGLADKPLRIALAAPTGKAAARLQESLAGAREALPPDLAAEIPGETGTIHRLLGAGPGGYRYSGDNLLHLDLLVLDEASMIDVPLMAGIVRALPPGARLIMLGDRDQLTSVEAGSLFADICALNRPAWSTALCSRLEELTGESLEQAGAVEETLGDSIIILQESYRFTEKSGLGTLARAVKAGNAEVFGQVATGGDYPDLGFHRAAGGGLDAWMTERLYAGFLPCFSAAGPREALAALNDFRVLCAVRDGAAGVSGINLAAEQIFRRRGVVRTSAPWYRGRPIMISVNHYGLQLFNGDTGIAWPDEEGRLWAWFLHREGGLRRVALSRLPGHETAYAVTVHKAQGSEFSEVLFILPPAESRVLNRELVYTGVTRARNRLTLCGDPELLAGSINQHVVRFSGLRDRLWDAPAGVGPGREDELFV
jgi:exodeoxyribonuclease V alpha subunit